MTTCERNVINWAKAVARALRRLERHPNKANRIAFDTNVIRLAKAVDDLPKQERPSLHLVEDE